MPTPKYDLMLCGGGVIGLSIALESARNGSKVIVVDSHSIGKGASWAGAGILPAGATCAALDPLEQLRSLSHRLHSEWADRLLKETGIDNEYRVCGGVYLAQSPVERATLSANQLWWDEHGIEFDVWDGARLQQHLPSLRPSADTQNNVKAWYVPHDCRLRNPLHIQALIQACEKHGVDLVPNQPIDHLEVEQNQIVAANSRDRKFLAHRYCITNGAWAANLLGTTGIETGIMPVRGQIVLYKLDKKEFSSVINDGHRYLVPREDGHVLAGSCEEEVGFNPTTTDAMIGELKQWAEGLCPLLTEAKVAKTWAGLRPGSFDTYPYLGTLNPFQNGFIASGHFRHGLHWSTATALLMVQWMNSEKTEIDLKPFCVQRGQTFSNPVFFNSHSKS